MAPSFKPTGFTLIELSIVLVIIGLIVGGVLVGQDLIRAAKWQQAASKVERFTVAVNTFKLKYNQLPGDFDKAYEMLGVPGCTSASDCNGNHNKLVGTNDTWPQLNESYTLWRDLVLAGLINDIPIPTDGRHSAYPFNGVPGVHVPKGPFDGSAFCYGGDAYNVNTYANLAGAKSPGFLFLADYTAGSNSVKCLALQRPSSTWNNEDVKAFDTKFDDGHAQSGRIRGVNAYWPHCTIAANNVASDYKPTLPDWSHCRITFINLW